MILPIIGAVVGLGATGVCWMGVTTETGSGPAGKWRIRWACWRWIAEKRGPATGAKWTRLGAYGEKGHAKAAAVLSVIGTPSLTAVLPRRMLKVT